MKIVLTLGFALALAATSAFAQETTVAAAQPTAAAAETPAPNPAKVAAQRWLEKPEFKLRFDSINLTYKTFPKEGFTYMTGWDSQCGQGKIPTTYAVDDDGKLTLDFTIALKGCPHLKYVFTGNEGAIYVVMGGKWTPTPSGLKVKLQD